MRFWRHGPEQIPTTHRPVETNIPASMRAMRKTHARSVPGLTLALIVLIAIVALAPATLAQQAATPEAGTLDRGTPAGVDTLLDGRLGGSLASVIDRFGEPDFTSDGLIRYDSIEIGGIPTILVVYHDASEKVTRLALVYVIRPAQLSDTVGIIPVAAEVAPADGSCDAGPVSSNFGEQTYPCHSDALAGVFTTDALDELGVTQGEPGDYAIAIDPLPDSYFELIIQPGTDGVSLVPTATAGEATPVASDEPTATPSLTSQYPALSDPTVLMDGDIPRNDALSFTGQILTLQVAGFGKQFRLGDDGSLGVSSLFQVEVPVEGSTESAVLFVGYNGDASALDVGDTVTVYGTNYGTQCFDNALGKEVCQPLIAADVVEK